jgi:chorismate-pyruvate lyase
MQRNEGLPRAGNLYDREIVAALSNNPNVRARKVKRPQNYFDLTL